MKKVLFSLLAVMFIMASCGGPSAVEFNDAIVKEQSTMVSAMNKFYGSVESPEKIKTEGDSLIAKLDASINAIKNLKTPSGGEKFRDTAVEYFESIKSASSTIIEKASTLNENSTQEDLNAYMQVITTVVKDAEEKEDALKAVQKEFAKEKNIMIR